jgi:hypothetical protein
VRIVVCGKVGGMGGSGNSHNVNHEFIRYEFVVLYDYGVG